ncbi:MAG TPA: arylsulfatase [Thermodesulfobacteriota bacterium]
MGYGWCDTFGGLVETPNITRLADNGLRYTNFHTTALCSPTRACLLTGRNHHSVGMANITEFATGFPGYNARQPMDKAGIGAMLRTHGYNTFAVGKWHNTPSEEVGPTGPYDRWPTGPLFGFDRFYGFMAGDNNQWYPKLHRDNTPVDPPATPEEGYHLSEDLVDRSIELIANNESVDPEKPWLLYLAFGACHAPHHVPKEWIDRYTGKFDMGWDRYREAVLARQKQAGTVAERAVLSPMMEGIPRWDDLSAEQKRLYARMAEVYAGFLSHADHQIGRLVDFLREAGDLDNTLIFVFIGDNGSSGEGTLDGLFNEMSLAANAPETLEFKLQRIDRLGLPGSYNHYPVGWAMAGNTPFKFCKQYVHFGGIRNPLVVHWPKGIAARGEIRRQFHHVIDIVPTILTAAGVEPPSIVNSVQQAPIEGVPMNYSFDDAGAPTTHPAQYFEMLGNRGLIQDGWKIVTYNGRLPWESRSKFASIDEQRWEMYHIDEDPAEANDLIKGRSLGDLNDPMVQRFVDLVGLWWAEAGRYDVLPLDDRFQERLLGRGDLYSTREQLTFYPGAVRIPEGNAPDTKNRSWTMTAHVEIPKGGAEGPICVMGGDTGGWSLYVKDDKAVYCYNLAASQFTYIRAANALTPGRHAIRYTFEKTGQEPTGAGGVGRLYVDDTLVAEGQIPRTAAFGYSLDETFDVGCDTGAPVTDEYPAMAAFTGSILKIGFDLKPDLTLDREAHREVTVKAAMIRQ